VKRLAHSKIGKINKLKMGKKQEEVITYKMMITHKKKTMRMIIA
jgi:hypothetical protein